MNVFIFTRKQVKVMMLTAVLALVASVGWGVGAVIASAKTRQVPVYSVETQEKKLALTFDVAWEDSDLEGILALLAKNKAKATFFVTGDWASRYPDGVKKILAGGHQVENHSNKHPHVAKLDGQALMQDAKACEQQIFKLTGKKSTLYRAPYGEYDNEMLEILQKSGYTVVQWDVDSRDWQPKATKESICNNVTSRVKPGSILLFHVDAKPKCTVPALEVLLPQLTGEGYSFVTAGELIPNGELVIDGNGRASKAS